MRPILWFAVLSVALATGAAAQDVGAACSALVAANTCACAVPLSSIEGMQAASLADSRGDVMVTTRAGYTPIAEDGTAPLYLDDSVVVPAEGSATLVMGPDCRRDVPSNSSLVIRVEGVCACAALVTLKGAPVVPIGPIVAGGAGAAGGVILVVTQSGGTPESP